MRGQRRDPSTIWLLSIVTCGFYGIYWWYTMGEELAEALGLEANELDPVRDILIGSLCFVYLFWLPIRYGRHIETLATSVGLPEQRGRGARYLLGMFLCQYGYAMIQADLNEIWEAMESPKGAPS